MEAEWLGKRTNCAPYRKNVITTDQDRAHNCIHYLGLRLWFGLATGELLAEHPQNTANTVFRDTGGLALEIQ